MIYFLVRVEVHLGMFDFYISHFIYFVNLKNGSIVDESLLCSEVTQLHTFIRSF